MEAEPTPVESGPPRWLRPIGVRLLVLIVAFLAVDVAFAALNTQAAKNPFTGLVAGVATAGAALFAYAKIVGWLEQRATPEVDPRSLRPQATRGLILGFALFTLTWLLIFIGNGYRAEWGSVSDMIATFGLMIGIATCEELLFRGVLFRIVEEWAGTLVAVAVSSVLFGMLHLLNPEATLWGAIAIAIQGGLLTAGAWVLTRKLWLPIGIHLGWNFALSGFFGATVSGSDGSSGGLLRGTPHGAAIISGGGFGPEASIFAVLVCGTAGLLILRKAHQQGKFVKAGTVSR